MAGLTGQTIYQHGINSISWRNVATGIGGISSMIAGLYFAHDGAKTIKKNANPNLLKIQENQDLCIDTAKDLIG
jgi:hypothetical protein